VKLGSCGDRLELEIARYQFEGPRYGADDLAWLVMRLNAEVDGRAWMCEDPFMKTDEVDRLST
jgi:hypothetical protein